MTDTQVRMINFMNNINLNYNIIDEDDQIRIEVFNHKGKYELNMIINNDAHDDCGIISGEFFNKGTYSEVTRDIAYEVLAAFNRKFNK